MAGAGLGSAWSKPGKSKRTLSRKITNESLPPGMCEVSAEARKRHGRHVSHRCPRRTSPLLVSEFHLRDEFQLPNQGLTLVGCQRLPCFFVGPAAVLDEGLVVFLSFRREVKQQCSPSLGFSFRYQSFPDHRLDGAVHHRAVEPQPLGDLILVEGSVAPQARENEATGRGAARLSFQPFANGEVGGGQMCENRIFENVVGDCGLRDHWRPGTHRAVTLASIGRRRSGGAPPGDFFADENSITIS